MLANRLRAVFRSIISPFQSAFLPGRQMSKSIVLAEEIVASWQRSGTKGIMWKVDFFSKAYDTLDWRFLWNALERRGLPETWVRWMKQCVTTPTFATLLNGRPQGGWIHPQRGIRQGCPLAPLLFILAADAFSGVYNPDVPKRLPHRISVTKCSYRYTFTAVRRRHDVLCSRNVGGSAPCPP